MLNSLLYNALNSITSVNQKATYNLSKVETKNSSIAASLSVFRIVPFVAKKYQNLFPDSTILFLRYV